MLSMKGHDTRIAGDGAEALALAHEFRPEVLVLDIAMPGLGGLDVARQLRAEPLQLRSQPFAAGAILRSRRSLRGGRAISPP